MQKSISSSDHGQPDDTEAFLRKKFKDLVNQALEKGDINEEMKTALFNLKPLELDELSDAYNQLIHAIENQRYYQILARVEKAETVIANETDIKKKDRYIKAMNELISKMEELKPV